MKKIRAVLTAVAALSAATFSPAFAQAADIDAVFGEMATDAGAVTGIVVGVLGIGVVLNLIFFGNKKTRQGTGEAGKK